MKKAINFNISIKVPHNTKSKDEKKLEEMLYHKAEQIKNLCITKIREAVKMSEGDVSEAETDIEISLVSETEKED